MPLCADWPRAARSASGRRCPRSRSRAATAMNSGAAPWASMRARSAAASTWPASSASGIDVHRVRRERVRGRRHAALGAGGGGQCEQGRGERQAGEQARAEPRRAGEPRVAHRAGEPRAPRSCRHRSPRRRLRRHRSLTAAASAAEIATSPDSSCCRCSPTASGCPSRPRPSSRSAGPGRSRCRTGANAGPRLSRTGRAHRRARRSASPAAWPRSMRWASASQAGTSRGVPPGGAPQTRRGAEGPWRGSKKHGARRSGGRAPGEHASRAHSIA